MSKKNIVRAPIDRIEPQPDRGLTAAAVEERTRKGYVNVATDPNEKSTLKIIAGNLFTFFNTVLLIIALLFVGLIIFLKVNGRQDVADTYFGFSKFVFLIPALMNVAMGTFQEIKSLKVIRKLKIVTGTKSRVVRDGEIKAVESAEIVPDDVVALSAGDQATADLIVLTGEVDVDESMLTGEADHIKKLPGDTILSGSSIIVGSARCRADKIGDDTYAAELTRKVKSGSRHKSELMSSIMKIIKMLTVGLSIAVIVVTVTMVVKVGTRGSDAALWDGMTLSLSDPVTWTRILLTDGMFGIGMIPTGLVLTTSVALMVSIAQLTKKQTLVQELYSLENLSRVDVICLDKTGTLTDGTMSVCDVRSYIPEEEVMRHARVLMGAFEERNATSEAFYQYFGAEEKPAIRELIPFSSANKYSGIVYQDGKKLLMGAPDYLIDPSDARFGYVTERAEQGNRVIAMTLDGELIALVAIEDHIRETAADTLQFFRENGVTVKVISGDNPLTVSRIAAKCGIAHADRYISLHGVALEDIPQIAEEYTVFARVSPEQKEALVMALQEKGHKVAMTGDGVNDILALRRSDSSITFAKATDAAKSCSDVILLDNDFSHLKEVVGEGRRVIGNIRKTAVLYLMKSTVVFILAFALIGLAKGQMWFSVENTYMLEAAVIGTGGFLLSLEPRRTPVKGSFLKNVLTTSVSAGVLAAIAILTPILLNTIPEALGSEAIIADQNVRPMMTMMVFISGIVVLFSMCIPLNKYRTLALAAVIGAAALLGFMFPTSYIGGETTVMNEQFFNEFFRPLNSPAVQGLVSDPNNFSVLSVFLYIAVPGYMLIYFALLNYNRKEYKDLKDGRMFRIGRRLMLSTGVALLLQIILPMMQIFPSMLEMRPYLSTGKFAALMTALFAVSFLQLAIGVIGYKVWKDPTRKMIIVGFIAGIVLFAVSVVPAVLTNSVLTDSDDLILTVDNIVSFITAFVYVIGAVIVFCNRKRAVAGKREKLAAAEN